MNTRNRKLRVSNLLIDAVKKDIKNMHLGVYPPTGRIRVAAPLATSDDTIRLFVVSRMPWIKRQQLRFLNQEREMRREYVTGESHYFFGKRHRLNVTLSNTGPKVEIRKMTQIDLNVKPKMTTQQRGVVLEAFYRAELRKHIASLLGKWQK